MPSPPIKQHALTVIGRFPSDKRSEVERRLEAAKAKVLEGLKLVETLHYGRLVVFECANGDAAIAFESNYDGDEREHLEQLKVHIGAHLDGFFAFCKGYDRGGFVRYAKEKARALPPRTFYMGHPGLSVQQIHHDRNVRSAIEAWLNGEERAGRCASMSPADIARGLKAHLAEQGLEVGPVDRGYPRQPQARRTFEVMAVGYGLVEAALAAMAFLVVEPADWVAQKIRPPKILSDNDPKLGALIEVEDHEFQNGLTHVVPVKRLFRGFRGFALRHVLSAIDQAAKKLYYEGTLGGIASIHFARWVLMGDGTLVFFSNYDGSWESYLGDFIDKSHWFLTAIWSNTKWFPTTHALAFAGATAETPFKQWARTFQVKNQIWYSAYPDLSVSNVNDNATIRELAGGALVQADDVKKWLAIL